jgi:hypothetical protein
MSWDGEPMKQVIRQNWLESERGWGTRPDGYSLHLTKEHRNAYISAYWDGMPKIRPNEYSRPSGDPYLDLVDDETFDEVFAAAYAFGIRRY